MHHLSEILVNSAERFSSEMAIEVPGETPLSYQQLADKSEGIKGILVTHGVSKSDRIGVFIPKSSESIIAIFASLMLKGAYVPVDANGPLERGAYIFKDCQAKAILVSPSFSQEMMALLPTETVLHQLAEFNLDLIICDYTSDQRLEFPENLAYLLYTSGSTGRPKGVMITHRNALCFIEWCAKEFDISQSDTFSSIAPFHFDLSIFDIYVPLLIGAKLVLFNEKTTKNPMLMAQYLADHRISVLYATPTLLKLILNYGKCPRYDHTSLRVILFAGEVFPIASLRKLKNIWNQANFYNLYGPTETNVVTWYRIPDEINESVTKPFPIGKPCPYVEYALWDDGMLKTEIGQKGELLISGESVAAAYLNLPDMNKKAFLLEEGKKWYRTGDIVEVNSDRDLVFRGRKDRMIKRNGYRIELGEVEVALSKHPSILESAIIVYINHKEEVKLKAFIKKEESTETLSTLELKQFCLQYLPHYMLPDKFTFIEEFPKTSTHKIDYQALKSQTL